MMPVATHEFPDLYLEKLPCRHHRLHRSHRMLHHRGLWWCYRCGYFCSLGRHGRSAPKKLLEPCVGRERRTRAGQGHLNRLARGLHPKVGSEWPDPLGTRVDLHDVLPVCRLRDKVSLESSVDAPLDGIPSAAPVDPTIVVPDDGVPDDCDELGIDMPCGLDTDSDIDEFS